MRIIRDIAYAGTAARQKLDLYLPQQECFDAFVYLHGGGLESGGKDEPMESLDALVEAGVAVVRANYRLYPDARYPEFIEDAAAAAAWAKAQLGGYGMCENLFLGGSSAGAYLAMMLCFDERYLGAHGMRPSDFAGFFFDAGQPTVHFNVLRERGLDTRRILIDEAAPLYHVGEPEGRLPVLITVAENDMPGRYEQIQLLRNTLLQFSWPPERVFYRYLAGRAHCDYITEPIFTEMVLQFIADTKMIREV